MAGKADLTKPAGAGEENQRSQTRRTQARNNPNQDPTVLVAIVPPPRVYTVIYSGVLAANAALRPEVIPKVPTSTDAEQAAREARTLKRRDGPTPSLRAQLTLS